MFTGRRRSTLIALTSVLAAPVAWACGDKVAALGGGVPFERLQSMRPTGQVIVLMAPGSGVRRVDDQAGLVKALSLAGHSVRVLPKPEQLETELMLAPANVVIVDQDIAPQVAPSMRSMSSPPAVLVVTPMQGGAAPIASARGSGCMIRGDLRQSRPVVRSVNQLVASQARGSHSDCQPTT